MLTRAGLSAWIVRAVKTKDVAVLKDDVDDAEKTIVNNHATNSTFSEADIVIEGTKCKRCCDQVDLKKEALNFFKCRRYFHGLCYKNQNSSPSALAGHFAPAVSKSGSYEKRFGHILFLGYFCFDEIDVHNPCSFMNLSSVNLQNDENNGIEERV